PQSPRPPGRGSAAPPVLSAPPQTHPRRGWALRLSSFGASGLLTPDSFNPLSELPPAAAAHAGGEVVEAGRRPVEVHLDGAGGAVALLGEDQLGDVVVLVALLAALVVVLAVE